MPVGGGFQELKQKFQRDNEARFAGVKSNIVSKHVSAKWTEASEEEKAPFVAEFKQKLVVWKEKKRGEVPVPGPVQGEAGGVEGE